MNFEQKKKTKAVYCYLLIAILLFLSLFTSFTFVSTAFADDSDIEYTTVLEDLQQDENFDIDDYPMIEDDYSLQVIQIAEGSAGELFVYVYQPSGSRVDLRATSINISTGTGDELSYKNYNLEYLNSYYTLYKYKVEDFTILTETIRYYDISAIYRAFIDGVDEDVDSDNTISEVAYEVAQLWGVYTDGGKIYYECSKTTIIEITDMYVGMIRYWNGLNIIDNSTDSHYVAFSTDWDISTLYEADVLYSYQKIMSMSNIFGESSIYVVEEGENVVVTVNSDTVISNPGGLFAKSYTWEQIQTVEDFINTHELEEDVINSLEGKQYVLSFLVTDYDHSNPTIYSSLKLYTEVTDVSILRLKFESQGITYNLGAVSNKQTGSNEPDNITFWDKIVDFFDSLSEGAKILFYAMLGLSAIIVVVLIIIAIWKVFSWLKNLFT